MWRRSRGKGKAAVTAIIRCSSGIEICSADDFEVQRLIGTYGYMNITRFESCGFLVFMLEREGKFLSRNWSMRQIMNCRLFVFVLRETKYMPTSVRGHNPSMTQVMITNMGEFMLSILNEN